MPPPAGRCCRQGFQHLPMGQERCGCTAATLSGDCYASLPKQKGEDIPPSSRVSRRARLLPESIDPKGRAGGGRGGRRTYMVRIKLLAFSM
eukprot:1142696-Pelagomonas_calceolata.AAC.5